jgi:plastocyanin
MRLFATLFIAFSTLAFADHHGRVIEIKTEKINDAIHWTPAQVKVKNGETVVFRLNHNVPGGFDFHGFKIAALKIEKQVNRGKALDVETTIPKELKKGEYPIACQFHPAHVHAKLIVE